MGAKPNTVRMKNAGVVVSASAAKKTKNKSTIRGQFWGMISMLFFLAGVMTPPLWHYYLITFQSSSDQAMHSTAATVTNSNRQRKLPVVNNDGSTTTTTTTITSCAFDSDALSGFLADEAVPGQHTLCLSSNDRQLVTYRNSKANMNQEGVLILLESATADHRSGTAAQKWWTQFLSDLDARLGLSKRRYPIQPWAIFTKDGERLVDESYVPSTAEALTTLVLTMQQSGVLLLFEGGQWVWPGIVKGFRRQVQLDYVVPNSGVQKQSQHNVTLVTLSLVPLVLSVEGFLSEEECNYIQDTAAPNMKYSAVTLMDKDKGRPASDFRTSQSTFLDGRKHVGLEGIDERTASLVRIPRRHQEWVQVLRYGTEEKYDSHHDYFDPKLYQNDPATLRNIEHGKKNRLATVFWYLTTVPKGGETIFPRADRGPYPPSMQDCSQGLKVQPERGKVIIFYSMTPDGGLDEYSLHGACPVEEGIKWAANKWVWNKPTGYY